MKRIAPSLAALMLVTVALGAPGDPGRVLPAGAPPMGGPGGPGGPGAPPFERFLYPPELVLNNQIAIGLTDDQIGAIKKLLTDTQTRVVNVQVDLQRAAEGLSRTLEASRVDETSALAASDQAMTLEAQMKKAHLTLLVRIKNLLTEDQQAKLDALRPARPEPPPAKS